LPASRGQQGLRLFITPPSPSYLKRGWISPRGKKRFVG
jgi:hypothetical protein